MATSPCLHTTGFVNIKRSARWQRHTSGKYINGKAVAKHRSGSKVVGAFVATGCFSWLAYIYEQRKCNRKMGFRLLNICICEGKSARLSSFTRTFFPPTDFSKSAESTENLHCILNIENEGRLVNCIAMHSTPTTSTMFAFSST